MGPDLHLIHWKTSERSIKDFAQWLKYSQKRFIVFNEQQVGHN